MSIIFIERAFTNSPHLFIETVWPCYTVHGFMLYHSFLQKNWKKKKKKKDRIQLNRIKKKHP